MNNPYDVDPHMWRNFEMIYQPNHDEISDIIQLNFGMLLVINKNGNRYIYNNLNESIRRLPTDPDNMSDEDVIFEFMLRFREMRALSRFNLVDVHEITGISMATLSRYDNGETTPNVINLRKIAKALNCRLDDLILMEY